MSFSAYPSSEMISPFAYRYCLNRIYNGPYLNASEANVLPISSPEIPSYLFSIPPNSLDHQPTPNAAMEAQKNPGAYHMHGFFNVQNTHQELLSNQTATNSIPIGGHLSVTKKSEIWRPFSPSPTKEPQEDIKGENQSLPLITPSRVKIEHSKTSLFKPVKKKGYRCSHCSSSFISSAQLISHLRVHTGSKPFPCDHPSCPKTFARNEELTRHLRIHTGYKPHECRQCGKSFGRKDHLAKHAKTHLHASEKRAYACGEPGCGHRYTRSDALARHRAAAHHGGGRRGVRDP